MDSNDGFKKIKNMLFKFYRSENFFVSIFRDVLFALFIVLIIILALWLYTGQWFSAPMVAIESGSMMHENEPFGRIGTIDAGDMVLLVKVEGREDVVTYIEKKENSKQYGNYGDVIVYKPDGNENREQIIHRAMCWVEVEYENSTKTYTIRECNIIKHSADEPIYCPECGIIGYDGKPVKVNWKHSGFITKGDNKLTNPTCDQIGGITDQPVKPEWISGKARGEIPWLGIINLLFNDLTSGKDSLKNVPSDSFICFGLLIAFIVSIPVSLDIYEYHKEKRQRKGNL